MLIVIEGIDGSGKQTQTELIQSKLNKNKKENIKLSFPDYESNTSALVKMYLAGEFGENASDINPYVASTFFAADRIGSYLSKWKKDYEKNTIILCDRYTTSNAIHQAGKLNDSDKDVFLDWLFDYEYNLLKLPKPDVVVFLDMPPEYGKMLTKDRSNKITGKEQLDIHEKDISHLINSYNSALYTAKKYNWKIVHCVENNKIKSIEEINSEIMKIIEEYI